MRKWRHRRIESLHFLSLLIYHVNNFLCAIFSSVEVYVINQKFYNSNGLYAHKSYIANDFSEAISEYKSVLNSQGYDHGEIPDEILVAPFYEPSFERRTKLLSGLDGFMLYVKLAVDFFSISERVCPNTNKRLRLIRARLQFYVNSDNPNVSLGVVVLHVFAPSKMSMKHRKIFT